MNHAPGAIRTALASCEPGTPVAIEVTANGIVLSTISSKRSWSRGRRSTRKAKLMMGQINKTDKLDTQGMHRLQRNGTPPTGWIPPGPCASSGS